LSNNTGKASQNVKQSGMPQGYAAKIAACGALPSRIQARRRGEAE
jgi:hypothetical protein